MNSSLSLIARVLLASVFLISGLRQTMAFGMVSGMMAGKGFPMPGVFLALAIILDLAGGIMLIANWNAKYAAWALAGFTLLVGTIFHGFWNFAGPEYNNEFNHFLKNVALTGGLLMVAATSNADEKVA